VTLGTWKGAAIVFADGKLIFDTDGLHYEFSRVGLAPDIYVGPGDFVVAEDDASAPFLGNWVEKDGIGVLTFNQDFTAVMNFTDGSVYDMNWKTTEDGAMFTSGNWFDTAMVIENETTLNIGDGWMILYREDAEDGGDDEMPTAQPIGPEGEPYFGTWTMDLGGMAMNLILNQDGTCAMEMMGEAEPGVWTVVDGKANVMGDELYIDDAGQLVMPSADMTFIKSEGGAAAPAAPGGNDAASSFDPAAYTGKKYVAKTYTVEGFSMDAAMLGAEYALTLNADQTCELIVGGYPVQLKWAQGEGALEIDYMGAATYYVYPTEAGLDLDMNGLMLNLVAE
jgi:hypothetical protein